jgi:hypothetical protein
MASAYPDELRSPRSEARPQGKEAERPSIALTVKQQQMVPAVPEAYRRRQLI